MMDEKIYLFNSAAGRLQKKALRLTATTAGWFRAKFGDRPWFTDGHVATDKPPVKNMEGIWGVRDHGPDPETWTPIDRIVRRLWEPRIEAIPIAEWEWHENRKEEAAVVFDAAGCAVGINRIYYDLIKNMYPESGFFVRKNYNGSSPIEVILGGLLTKGTFSALIMPMRLPDGSRSVKDIIKVLAEQKRRSKP